LGKFAFFTFCLPEFKVEDAHWFEQMKEGSHPVDLSQARFGLVEEAPLVE
jgi:hypothetical protein